MNLEVPLDSVHELEEEDYQPNLWKHNFWSRTSGPHFESRLRRDDTSCSDNPSILNPPRRFKGARIVFQFPTGAVDTLGVVVARERTIVEVRPTHLGPIVTLTREAIVRVVIRRVEVSFP